MASDGFADELDLLINSVSAGKEVISMDETQRRAMIYGEWVNNMSVVWRALKRNQKIMLTNDEIFQDTRNVLSLSDNKEPDPVVITLKKHFDRSPDRMILSPNYDNNRKTSPEELAKYVSVSFWPTHFPEDYSDDEQDELDFEGARSYKIDDLEFKKCLAMFIAGKLEG